MGYDLERFQGEVDIELICTICEYESVVFLIRCLCVLCRFRFGSIARSDASDPV